MFLLLFFVSFILFNSAAFVLFCGTLPGLSRTPIGRFHQWLWRWIGRLLLALDFIVSRGLFSRWLCRTGSRASHPTQAGKRPLHMIILLCGITTGAMIFIPEVWVFVTWPTRITIIGLLPLPYVFIYLGNQTSPQTTTPATLERYRDIYPYDFKLFYPDLVCRTCRLTKPARSKHCSLCCFCVARADHHCVWLNNCVGRGNYKYFISLLVSLIAVLSFTLWQAYYTLAMQLKQCANVEQSHYLIPCANPDAFDVPLVKMHIKDLVQAAFKIRGVARIATGTAAFVFIPMPVGLLSYHIYLIYTGMTTSEKSRWERWRGEVAAGSAFLAPVQLATDSGYQRSDWHKSTWPNRSSQVLVATSDGHPPRKLPEQIAAVVGEAAEWHRCSTLEQVENIYDLGPWRNLLAPQMLPQRLSSLQAR